MLVVILAKQTPSQHRTPNLIRIYSEVSQIRTSEEPYRRIETTRLSPLWNLL
jgi:hypothetical protein